MTKSKEITECTICNENEELAKQELMKAGLGNIMSLSIKKAPLPKPPTTPKMDTSLQPVSSVKASKSTSVKTPKAKKPADPFGKPSLFFKNEDFSTVKHPSVRKLKDFLTNKKGRK